MTRKVDLPKHALDGSGRPGPAVRWMLPAAEDEQLLASWRLAVGPPLTFQPSPDGSGPPAKSGDDGPGGALVVVWNLRVGGGAIGAFWEHVQQVAEGRPVVLLLQEAFSSGSHIPAFGPEQAGAGRIADEPPGESRTDIREFAAKAQLHGFYVPSMRNGPGSEDRGNAILSTEPLDSLGGVELPFERQRRVAAVACLALAGLRIRVCSVHLDNRAPWRRAWRSLGAARKRQMEGLLASLDGDGAGVLGGDLNTWVGGEGEGAFKLARARFPEPGELDPRPTHRFEIGGVLRRSDHLLVRLPANWGAEVRRLDRTFGSDHYPLLAVLQPRA